MPVFPSDRYDYVPITKRTRMELPNGNRVAVWVAPNVEYYEYLPPPRVPAAPGQGQDRPTS